MIRDFSHISTPKTEAPPTYASAAATATATATATTTTTCTRLSPNPSHHKSHHHLDTSDLTIIRDIPYISGSKLKAHRFDIYHAKDIKVDEKLAVVIHVHGGGWQRGNSRNEWRGAPHIGRSCGRHDAIGVCINYRMATPSPIANGIRALLLTLFLTLITTPIRETRMTPYGWMGIYVAIMLILYVYNVKKGTVSHPATIQDVASAIAYIHTHITEYVPQADTNTIFLSGHSAGGHLVSLMVLDEIWLHAAGVTDTSFIKGVISMSGIYTIDSPCHPNYDNWRNFIFRLMYATSAFGSNKDVWTAVSPIKHVHKVKHPFLVMSAEHDMGLETDAERFVTALRSVGAHVECEVIATTSHASIASQFIRHHARHHFFEFIHRTHYNTMQQHTQSL